MALAEAGYPDAYLYLKGHYEDGEPILWKRGVPDDVWWRACNIALEGDMPCWACVSYRSGDVDRALRCRAGDCAAGPGESRGPPRRQVTDPTIPAITAGSRFLPESA